MLTVIINIVYWWLTLFNNVVYLMLLVRMLLLIWMLLLLLLLWCLTSEVSHNSAVLPFTRFPTVRWKKVLPLDQLMILLNGCMIRSSCRNTWTQNGKNLLEPGTRTSRTRPVELPPPLLPWFWGRSDWPPACWWRWGWCWDKRGPTFAVKTPQINQNPENPKLTFHLKEMRLKTCDDPSAPPCSPFYNINNIISYSGSLCRYLHLEEGAAERGPAWDGLQETDLRLVHRGSGLLVIRTDNILQNIYLYLFTIVYHLLFMCLYWFIIINYYILSLFMFIYFW